MRKTVAVAESCTGGLLGSLLTDKPGASDFFLGGILAYHDRTKNSLLGVPAGVLDKYGAVSRQTALLMAKNVRKKLGSSIGVAVTGIAGPKGGSAKKPVGLVYIALAGAKKEKCRAFRFSGNRSEVRRKAANTAFAWIRKEIF